VKLTRRKLLVDDGVGLALSVGFYTSTAGADPPVVEIVAFAHPPLQAALKPLREWLSSQGTWVRVVEIDMESPAAAKRLPTLGIGGHVPIVILVNGQYKHIRKDGSRIELVSFPARQTEPAGAKGSWSTEDAQAIVKGFMGVASIAARSGSSDAQAPVAAFCAYERIALSDCPESVATGTARSRRRTSKGLVSPKSVEVLVSTTKTSVRPACLARCPSSAVTT